MNSWLANVVHCHFTCWSKSSLVRSLIFPPLSPRIIVLGQLSLLLPYPLAMNQVRVLNERVLNACIISPTILPELMVSIRRLVRVLLNSWRDCFSSVAILTCLLYLFNAPKCLCESGWQKMDMVDRVQFPTGQSSGCTLSIVGITL